MSSLGSVAEVLGYLAHAVAGGPHLLWASAPLILGAVFPIYVGAHASLSRPASADPPAKRSKVHGAHAEDDDDDDEERERPRQLEGLAPIDALLFPLTAGAVLSLLYFLIKWLQDPAILNKLLNWHLSLTGVFGLANFIADGLHLAHTVILPRAYVFEGEFYRIRRGERKAVPVTGPGDRGGSIGSPLPGLLSQVSLSSRLAGLLWSMRDVQGQKWAVKAYVRGVVDVNFRLGMYSMLATALSLMAWTYFNLVSRPWWLTDIIGLSFSYAALQLLSPTTFATGSLLLAALFFYDIYFVFYTPMMVTVATSIDAPIKLLIPNRGMGKQFSVLGLGDIVIPGMMIALALRFDLYLFYLRKQAVSSSTAHDGQDATAEAERSTSKAPYVSVSRRWGDRLWTWLGTQGSMPWSESRKRLRKSTTLQVWLTDSTFPKCYFHAGLAGYVVGMFATVTVMERFEHAQPALLYLVPSVLIALWGVALVRGERDEMWNFTDVIEQEPDARKERGAATDGAGGDVSPTRHSFFSSTGQDRVASRIEARLFEESSRQAQGLTNVGGDDRHATAAGADPEKPDTSRRCSCKSHAIDLVSFAITSPYPSRREERREAQD